MDQLLNKFNEYKKMNLSIDMTRGKPSKTQLDLSMPMMDVLDSKFNYLDNESIDVRNYGKLDGISECKKLFADLGGVNIDNVLIYGNSSLNIMYECIADAFIYGICGMTPWSRLDHIKWLCPVPGYDRHFAICEHLGIEMINIPMNEFGPDMDMVEELIKDPSVKGIWCVPKYSNPAGITYSKEVVARFAKLKPAAKDFRIYWDDAYTIHHLYDDRQDYLPEILTLAKSFSNEDIVYKFVSTSKITFPGSGVSSLIASKRNLEDKLAHLKYKIIGYDKINQLRHARYFKNLDNLKLHMKKHADILRPKFELIEDMFSHNLKGLATWSNPNGGYFISLYVKNKAKEVISRCNECGVKISDVGCAYPYHIDKDNSHIRIAPSYVSLVELKIAIEVLCLAVKIETSNSEK